MFPKWIYKGNFGNSQRVNIYFGYINSPRGSLEYRNAPQDRLSMFVPLAAAAERVSLQDRMQGLLPSHPIQNPAAWKREVQMLLAAHTECLHLAPQFIPAGTPRSAASLWEASEHRETNTARAFCCFTSSGTNLHWVIKCALCRIITSPFRCAWNKSLFLFSFNPKISFQNALGYLKRKKKPKTCF